MSEIKRIDPKEVLAKYKKLGVKPERFILRGCITPNGAHTSEMLPGCPTCACGIGIMVWGSNSRSVATAYSLLGISKAYSEGFTDGFDGASVLDESHRDAAGTVEYTAGFSDGQEAANLVFAEGAFTRKGS